MLCQNGFVANGLSTGFMAPSSPLNATEGSPRGGAGEGGEIETPAALFQGNPPLSPRDTPPVVAEAPTPVEEDAEEGVEFQFMSNSCW